MIKTCKKCGKEFKAKYKQEKYCSDECKRKQSNKSRLKHYYNNREKALAYSREYYKKHPEKIKEYNLKNYQKRKESRAKITRKCPVCGVTFNPNRTQKYCSEDCKKKVQKQRRHERYLKHKRANPIEPICGRTSCFDCPYEDCIA